MPHTERKRIIKDAKTAVLFLHGIVGSPHHFEKFYDHIPNNISYHAVLLEGHGGSVKDFGKAKMKNWKKQVEDATDTLCATHDRVIVVGHSMGTLFAIAQSLKYPEKITDLFLLNSPMKAYLNPIMIKYSCQFLLKISETKNPKAMAAVDVIAVKSDIFLWRYLSWIPRFLELFAEIRATRPLLEKTTANTTFYQSYHDELVPRSAVKYIVKHKHLGLKQLNSSTHFYYDDNDVDIMISDFERLF